MREIVREVWLIVIMAGIGVAVGQGRVWITNLDTAWSGEREGEREGVGYACDNWVYMYLCAKELEQ